MEEFILESNSLHAGDKVPNHFVYNGMGCDGENISPALRWHGAPPGTKSYAITVFDPDAPRKNGWWHWSVVNIPAEITELPEGASNQKALPEGAVEINTDFGHKNYGGPCPPPGTTHRYVFTVYALDTSALHVSPEANANRIEGQIREHSLAQASFTMTYGR